MEIEAKVISTEPKKELNRYEKKMLDRQLRVFGKDLQLKLMNSKIAIIGLSGLNLEIAKNLVLKAFNIDIFDSSILTKDDIEELFLFSEEDLGKKEKSEISAGIFRDMNPIVKISAMDGISGINDDQFKRLLGYDLIVVDCKSCEEIRKWDLLASNYDKVLISTTPCGFFGFAYISLMKNFTCVKIKNKDKENETSIQCKTGDKMSFDQCLNLQNFTANKYPNTPYIALNLKNKYEETNKEPTRQEIEEILREFYQMKDENYERYIDRVQQFIQNFGVDFCPVNSVIGSIISQEIVLIYQREILPALNWVFYNSFEGYSERLNLTPVQKIDLGKLSQ